MLDIEASDLDLTHQEIREGYQLLCYGAFAESTKLFGENIEQFNLPKELEVSLVDHTIRLSNVENLLFTEGIRKAAVFKDDAALKAALENLFSESIALEKIYQIIHNIKEKNFNSYQNKTYPYESAACFIKQKREAFLKKILNIPKAVWDVKNPNFYRSFGPVHPKLLASASELTKYTIACKTGFEAWVHNLKSGTQYTDNNLQILNDMIEFLEEMERIFPGDASFDTSVFNIASVFYKRTSRYKLFRAEASSLFGEEVSLT